MASGFNRQRYYENLLLELYQNLESKPSIVYDFLSLIDDLDVFITGNAINYLGILHDASDILDREEGFQKITNLGTNLQNRDLSPEEEARLEYTLGNAQTGLLRIHGGLTSWDWEKPEMEVIIRRFRRALDSKGIQKLTSEEIQKSYTNLGNVLSNIGRWIEAFWNWRKAIEIDPPFLRALGQIGMSLLSYARHVPNPAERVVLFQTAHDYLRQALLDGQLHQDMRERFQQNLKWLQSNVSSKILQLDIDLSDISLGSSKEQKYREWCLENVLFLNPLNDVTTESRAAKDSIHLPKVSQSDSEKLISCTGFLNQIKQEYVSARHQLWRGISASPDHYSDKAVTRRNTFDYSRHSMGVELIKSGFRASYSIFDKIAKFISHYFGLNYIKEHKLYFSNVWYKSGGKNQLAPEFQNKKNWPLRGLFWLSKDLEFNS
ncbi:hypothetical protein FXF75_18870 [Halorussus sp. MSC15.2]|nr:hypothetical protein [Halorussus sp. MSC15.2]